MPTLSTQLWGTHTLAIPGQSGRVHFGRLRTRHTSVLRRQKARGVKMSMNANCVDDQKRSYEQQTNLNVPIEMNRRKAATNRNGRLGSKVLTSHANTREVPSGNPGGSA